MNWLLTTYGSFHLRENCKVYGNMTPLYIAPSITYKSYKKKALCYCILRNLNIFKRNEVSHVYISGLCVVVYCLSISKRKL